MEKGDEGKADKIFMPEVPMDVIRKAREDQQRVDAWLHSDEGKAFAVLELFALAVKIQFRERGIGSGIVGQRAVECVDEVLSQYENELRLKQRMGR